MTVQATRTPAQRVELASPYWQIGIALDRGGTIDRIVFPHGSGRNLLLEPLGTRVDDARDTMEPAERVAIEETGRGVRVTCEGSLYAPGGRAPTGMRYRHVYEADEDVFLVSTTLIMEREARVSVVGIGETTFTPTLTEFGYRPNPWDDPDRETRSRARRGAVSFRGWPMVEMHHIPLHFILFARYVEGLDWAPSSDFWLWEEQLTGRNDQSHFALTGRRDGSGIGLECKVLLADEPVAVAAGSYTYAYYLGLPKIMERTPRKWYHLAFSNHPWPSEETVQRWAKAGVNVVRLHNDYAADGNFWHDGTWPPYDDAGMAELRRVIGSCHRHGIKVIPYFSIHELHPVSPGYEHVQEWCRTMAPDQTPYHNSVRNGEYGAQMCPHSGWTERLKQNVERAYRELGFDGIYYDWMRHLPCTNRAHSPGLHSGIDEVIAMGRWTREFIGPDGVLILHIYGDYASIPMGNMSDLLVCMEELSQQEALYYHWKSLPLASVLGETVQRCPCRPYRLDHAEIRLKSQIAQLSVMGMFPCDATEQTLRLFAAFSRYSLEEYRFHGPWTGVVDTSDEAVAGALYTKPDRSVLVLSNTTELPITNVRWRVNLSEIGWGDAGRYRLTVPSLGDQCQEISGSQLSGTGLRLSLPGLEYQVIEIEPVGA